MGRFLTKRNGTWHYVRRVPDEYAELDKRGIVKVSTKVKVADDRGGVKAQRVAEALNKEQEAYWRGMVDGRAAEAKARYLAAQGRARALGFDYIPAQDLFHDLDVEVVERTEQIERLAKAGAPPSGEVFAALLGGEPVPDLQLSGLFERFEELSKASLTDLSPDQIRKWGNPKKKAIANLMSVIGDKAIKHITRNDALDFREWWQERIIAGEVEIGTANKDIGHLNKMFRTLDRVERLKLDPVFADLRIEGEKDASRIPYPVDYVQKNILATGALDSLNEEARAVVYLIAETGLRLSEAVNLNETTIFLDSYVPHVAVRPDGRRMKTDQSERDIPLVGVALEVMKANPKGFPRYRDKGASLSAIANKVMGNAGLRPNGQSLYSLRHTFEDRLTAIEAPEKVIANLMGHKWQRPKYGNGPSLEQKHEWLQRIAFKPPSRL